jgi:NAD(P)-dependent dehydrogenase (short-subunit alcohol dehydrogenase family)
MPGNTAYCLSKGGLRMLTRTAGLELATTVFADGGLILSSPGF